MAKRGILLTTGIILMLSFTGCVTHVTETLELRAALKQEYNIDDVNIGFRNTLIHLTVELPDTTVNDTPLVTSKVSGKAR